MELPIFLPVAGVDEEELAKAAMLSSLADDTPEGRSIVVLAKDKLNVRGRDSRRGDQLLLGWVIAVHEVGAHVELGGATGFDVKPIDG